jgi:PAS domain S-box-containing protein
VRPTPERAGGVVRVGRGALWLAWLLLAFAVAVLVLLALVPSFTARQTEEVQRRAEAVLEPARHLVAELGASQAREMIALQDFILTGSGADRQRSREARDRSVEALNSLSILAEGSGPEVREALFQVGDFALQWRLSADLVLEEQVTRDEFLGLQPENRRLFNRMQDAALRLEQAVAGEVAQARGEVDRIARRQSRLTAFLALLALLAAAGLVGVARRLLRLIRAVDVERAGAQRARKEADAVLASAAEGVFGVDRTGRCTFANPSGLELLGLTSEELLGRRLDGFLEGTSGGREVRDALATGSSARIPEVLIPRRDTSPFHARVAVDPVPQGGPSLAAVVTVTDLTEAREGEEALRRALAARDQVLAVVSHDLRNPVAAAKGAAELLLEFDLSPARRKAQLETIDRAAARMDRLISDLLDVAAVEAGGLSIRPGSVDPRELLESVRRTFEPRALEAGLSLVMEPTGVDVGLLGADPDRLLQALENLVANAIKFSPRGSEIRLAGRRERGTYVLEVLDQGPGIPEKDRERLFEAFSQLEGGDPRGAGLGLAIVKGVAEAHGGRVEIASAPGEGSVFRVILPLERVSPAPETSREVGPPGR